MKPVPQQLENLIAQAFGAAQAAGQLPQFEIPAKIPVSPPKKAEQGDYATPVAMGLAKALGLKPLDIVQALADHFPTSDLIAGVEVAPPGFLNIRLQEAWIRAQVETVIQQGAGYFNQDFGAGKRAQVEFVSANPTGPLHIGRTRGAIIGDSWARLLEVCGWDVQREYYFNNAGRQMEMLGKSLQARYLQILGQNAEIPEGGYHGDYLVEIARELQAEQGDSWVKADWQPFKEYAEAKIFVMLKNVLARVGVRHDAFFNEQSVYDDGSLQQTLERLKAAGYVYEAVNREGESEEGGSPKAKGERTAPATWFKSTALGDNEDRVLVKSNGDPTYLLPDIAYHINKLDRNFDIAFNILGSDHVVEARAVAYGLQALGYDSSKVEVIFNQFVTFKQKDDAEAKKMSTRGGNYVPLDELVDYVGADVVRYFMQARSPNSHIEFDLDLAREQSNDNPVYYIQNAHVRCCGIFRQIAERGYPENWDDGADLSLLGQREMEFIRKVLELPEQIILGYENRAPQQIAFYALDLARLFHPLYDEVRVLHGDVPEDLARARARFYRMAQTAFVYVLGLMGMSAPERM